MSFPFEIKNSDKLPEVKLLSPVPFFDDRGEMWTFYDKEFRIIEEQYEFKISKFSKSKKGVLRGLHTDPFTWKYISCVQGEMMLAVVDYRKESKNYLKYDSLICNDKNHLSVLIPPNFANGHLCISDTCIFHYMQSYPNKYIDVQDQTTIKWNDKRINIDWPIQNPILSERDR